MAHSFRIGLVGPDRTQPCGIADYTARLADAMGRRCDLVFVPFRDALPGRDLESCRAILVQYERSLVPDEDFLPGLSRKYPGRVFVAPHEVYAEDPFAFPYASLRSAFPPLLWMKRLRYRWEHRDYAREKSLQRRAYAAHRVIPFSGPTAAILRASVAMGGLADGKEKILEPIPLAVHVPPEPDPSVPAPKLENIFPAVPKAVIGIFGFLNPGLDYALVLDLLERSDPKVCLLIVGGKRAGAAGVPDPESEAAARGLAGRVHVTGYVPETALSAYFGLCSLFLCPMRFKSNSSSLLNLFHLGKPVLASDIPLTRYLKEQGAPLELFADTEDLAGKAEAVISGNRGAQPNRYPWTFDSVAEAYIRVLRSEISS
jgi:glycosyltransferase involved in cell wall biosynthesis